MIDYYNEGGDSDWNTLKYQKRRKNGVFPQGVSEYCARKEKCPEPSVKVTCI